jgi:hypothetical protein
MSGLNTEITNVYAPYNTIIRNEGNDQIKDSTNTKDSTNLINTITQNYNSGIIDDEETRDKLKKLLANKNTSETEIVNLMNNYLSGKHQNLDNKTALVSNKQSNDPLNGLVNNYLSSNNSMYDNRGKYFDQYLFNQKFDQMVEEKNKERLLKEKVKLNDLNQIDNIRVEPYQLPINKLLINIKNTWFNMYDNFVNKRTIINLDDETQEDSLFYIGITLIIIALLYIIISYIFD